MTVLYVPLLIVALILFILAALKPHPAMLPLGLAFLTSAFLVQAVW